MDLCSLSACINIPLALTYRNVKLVKINRLSKTKINVSVHGNRSANLRPNQKSFQ